MPWMTLDPWQKEILETKGKICVSSGRQVGKSTVISIKAAELVMKNANKTVMIIAFVERQAMLLFEKVMTYINHKAKYMVKGKPTKHKLELKNGSVIHCLPTGETGWGIMGFTIDLLIADEAHYINDAVWNSVMPTIAVTGGDVWLLSTPAPKGCTGFFYECFRNPEYTKFHISSEDNPRRDDKFLATEKLRMTRAEYARVYLGEFPKISKQFFSDDLIARCCTGKRPDVAIPAEYYLGVDIARMGADESTFEVVELRSTHLVQVENIITTKTELTKTTERILVLDSKYHFRRIYLDDGGLGVGVYDNLREKEQVRRKVIAVNNAKRSIEWDSSRSKKLLKEDLYMNLKRLMEQGRVQLLDDDEIRMSLRSISYEYTDNSLKISGDYSHIVEGLIRAVWCAKDKNLNIYITFV